MENILHLDPNERVKHYYYRHPIGVLPTYVSGALFFLIFLGGVYALAKYQEVISENFSFILTAMSLVALAILVFVVFFIQVYLYKRNYLILTTENLIQVAQPSLFNRKVSHLSLGLVQDVSAHQDSLLGHLFNFGTITIETAGEASNFRMTFMPDPNVVAKTINESHDFYVRELEKLG